MNPTSALASKSQVDAAGDLHATVFGIEFVATKLAITVLVKQIKVDVRFDTAPEFRLETRRLRYQNRSLALRLLDRRWKSSGTSSPVPSAFSVSEM